MLSTERGWGRPGRREFLTLGVGAFVVASAPLAARRPALPVRRTLPVMGTIAEVVVTDADPRRAQAAIDAALEELRRVERLMTWFSPDSDVGRVNALAATAPVAVSDETAGVLRDALAWAEASDGAFDPGVGRVVGLWDVIHRRVPPRPELVRRLAGRRFYRAVDVDRWRGRAVVRFADREVALDLGGIAKGHAVDRAADVLRRRGITRAIVAVGGDLFALGTAADGGPWRVGVRLPDDPARLADTLEVREAAVATSGDYFRFFSHGGRRYHHLLDPATAAPRRTPARSVTVTAARCVVADAAATAVFGMAPARAERLLAARAAGATIGPVLTDT